jgi:hypothetical protein
VGGVDYREVSSRSKGGGMKAGSMKAGSMNTGQMATGLRAGWLIALTLAAGTAAAQPAGFWKITPNPGERVLMTSVSPDGLVAAANVVRPGAPFIQENRAHRWSRENGLAPVQGIETFFSKPVAIISNGQRVLMQTSTSPSVQSVVKIQDGTSAPFTVPIPSGLVNPTAVDMSHDGRVVVATAGRPRPGSTPAPVAFRWTAEAGPVELDNAGTGAAGVWAVSGDGGTIVGDVGAGVPVIWRGNNAPVAIPAPTPDSFAWAGNTISTSGRFVTGVTLRTSIPSGFAIWDNNVPIRVVPAPAGTGHDGTSSISDNGKVVAFNARPTGGSSQSSPYVWNESRGTLGLVEYLATFGVAADPTLTLVRVTEMTPDGRTFVGWGLDDQGRYCGFVATIPTPMCGGVLAIAGVIATRRRRAQ